MASPGLFTWAEHENVEIRQEGKTVCFVQANTTAVITNEPLDLNSDFFIQIKTKTCGCFPSAILFGISSSAMDRLGYSPLLGSTSTSWGWRIDGTVFHEGKGVEYSPHYTKRGITKQDWNKYELGMQYSAKTREIRFWDGDTDCGVAFCFSENDIKTKLYPSVCFAADEHVVTFKENDGVLIKPAKRK
mmetsp:Transcript_42443/g.59473  ORF Transcript_42443/g.59473 Transcript_42443/m.59473 type:complete len:188 (+) Transcript_42443:213-776(+)